jgi:hypothetical protein
MPTMYVSYNHLSAIQKAYLNVSQHVNDQYKDEMNQLLHLSIGHVNNIDPALSLYSEMFKEDS